MISKHETDFWSPYELQANAVSPHGEAHVAETLPAAVASLSMFLGHVLEYHFFYLLHSTSSESMLFQPATEPPQLLAHFFRSALMGFLCPTGSNSGFCKKR